MKQNPIHDNFNPDLLRIIPKSVKRVIEVGCSSGALAREFKMQNQTDWFGIEINNEYAEIAKKYCGKTECL
jgi:spermidine synthase